MQVEAWGVPCTHQLCRTTSRMSPVSLASFQHLSIIATAPVSLKGHHVLPLALERDCVFLSSLSCKCPKTFHPVLVFGHPLLSQKFHTVLGVLIPVFQTVYEIPVNTCHVSFPRSKIFLFLLPWEVSNGISQGPPGTDVANS